MAKSCNCLNKNKPLIARPPHIHDFHHSTGGVKRKVPHLGLQILSLTVFVSYYKMYVLQKTL